MWSSASLLLGCILSKIEVMLYAVVKVLCCNPIWDCKGFVCARHSVVSWRLHTIAYFLRCVNTFLEDFEKIEKISPNVLYRVDEGSAMKYAC